MKVLAVYDAILVRRTGAAVTLGLWLLSLVLPALMMTFDPANGPIELFGHQVLSSGGMDLFAGQFAWLANFALIALLAGLARRQTSDRFLRWVAIILAILSLDTIDLALRPAFYGYPRFLPGYYVWMFANLAIAAFVLVTTTKRFVAAP